MMLEIGSAHWCASLKKGASCFSLSLDSFSLDKLALYANELLLWNRKINLTAITTADEVLEKHFIDSLAVCPYLPHDADILDMGTGAGFPGIPLKIVLPELKMTLIDASVKKVSFLKHIIRLLDLKDIRARHTRAEHLAQGSSTGKKYEVILCRAFSSLSNFLDLALPVLVKGGKAFALKGHLPNEEIRALGGNGLTTQSICWHRYDLKIEVHTYSLPYSNANRTLICFQLN